MIGETLAARYRLEAELGRGGMGTVYRAVDLRLARAVAVKVMHPTLSEKDRARFLREAELVASVKHPNVLEIHDAGEDGGIPFLVTELVEGTNLRKWAELHAPLPPSISLVLGMEVARALSAAHARGIVHRDVKPENVMVQTGGALKLADFGIAAASDQDRLTTTGSISGSLPYMAPERIDTGEFSPASDVYAVGVMLFELCAGRTPFAGKGAAHLAAAALTREPPALADLEPSVPERVSTLVATCLKREPKERFAEGAALLGALEQAVKASVGPPADSARQLVAAPGAFVAEHRRKHVETLLTEGRSALKRGEGAKAAKLLDAAARIDPSAAVAIANLARGGGSAARWRWIGAVAVGVAVTAAAAWWIGSERESGVSAQAERGSESREAGRAASGSAEHADDERAQREGDRLAAVVRDATRDPAQRGSAEVEATTSAAERDATQNSAQSNATQNSAQRDATQDSAQRDATQNSAQRDATQNSAQRDATQNSARRDTTQSSAQRDATQNSAQRDATQSSAQRDATRDSAQRDATRESAQRNATQNSAQRDATRESAQRDATQNSAQRDATRDSAQRDTTRDAAQRGTTHDSAQRESAPRDATQPNSARRQSGAGTSDATSATTSVARLGDDSVPATLRFSTRPWAEVFLNGKSAGYTPKLKSLPLPAGTYSVRLVNPLCEPLEEQLTVEPGAIVQRDWVLKVREGGLRVTAPAGALLYVDGVQVGTAPLRAPLSLTHGDHSVEAKLPGGGSIKRTVRVVAGETTPLQLEASR